MNKTTFVNIIGELKNLYDAAIKQNKKFEEAFGGDTYINTDWWSKHIDNTLLILKKDFEDQEDWIDWLFWESICSNNGCQKFYLLEVEFEGTSENVFDFLTKSGPFKI